MNVNLLLFIFLKNFGSDDMTYLFPLLENLNVVPKWREISNLEH